VISIYPCFPDDVVGEGERPGEAGIGNILSFQLRIHLLHSLARSDAPRVVRSECGAAQALAEDFVAGAGAEGVVELGEDAALDLDVTEMISGY
jgi:hypothetical protein